ncbi:hypothetical protein [Yersinia enterocolitica]
MKVSTLGIDLAKNVFQLHGVGCNGQTVLKRNSPAINSSLFSCNLNLA